LRKALPSLRQLPISTVTGRSAATASARRRTRSGSATSPCRKRQLRPRRVLGRVAGHLVERRVRVDDRVVLEPGVGEDEPGAGQVERLAHERELAAETHVLGLQPRVVLGQGEPDAHAGRLAGAQRPDVARARRQRRGDVDLVLGADHDDHQVLAVGSGAQRTADLEPVVGAEAPGDDRERAAGRLRERLAGAGRQHDLVPVAGELAAQRLALCPVRVGDEGLHPRLPDDAGRQPVGHLGEREHAGRLALPGDHDEPATGLVRPDVGVEDDLQTRGIEEVDAGQVDRQRGRPALLGGQDLAFETSSVVMSTSPRTAMRMPPSSSCRSMSKGK
jgi:hypothetical protein